MTLFGFDISHHQPNFDIGRAKVEGFSFGIARIGQGAGRRLDGGIYRTTKDRAWGRHRKFLDDHFNIWCAYWYIGDMISPAENARLCREWMGDPLIPVILDHEDGSGSVSHFRKVLQAFKDAGIHVPFSYIPRWYWSHPKIGSPSLAGLPPLWSSRYVNGSNRTASSLYPGDGSSFWSGYGSNEVKLLQFSSSAAISNYPAIDANAFRGSLNDLRTAFFGVPAGKIDKAKQTNFMLLE